MAFLGLQQTPLNDVAQWAGMTAAIARNKPAEKGRQISDQRPQDVSCYAPVPQTGWARCNAVSSHIFQRLSSTRAQGLGVKCLTVLTGCLAEEG